LYIFAFLLHSYETFILESMKKIEEQFNEYSNTYFKKGNPLLCTGLNVEVVQRALIVRNMSESWIFFFCLDCRAIKESRSYIISNVWLKVKFDIL
jgi:hypothetical protein